MVAFDIGDLVWAKMKGFSPWPSRIVEPDKNVKPPKAKEQLYYVFFFGSNNYSWIVESNILTYEEGQKKYGQKNTGAMKKAIQDMNEYAEKNPPKRKIIPTAKATGIASLKPQPKQAAPTPPTKTSAAKQKTSSVKRATKILSKAESKKRRISDDSDDLSSTTSSVSKNDKYSIFQMNASSETKRSKKNILKSSFVTSDSHLSVSTPPRISQMCPDKPDSPIVDFGLENEKLRQKNIIPTDLKIGFLGLGVMGSVMIKNLLQTGHKVSIWNKSSDRFTQFDKPGANMPEIKNTIAEVVKTSDIIFSCFADSNTARELFYGTNGVLQSFSENKGFVQMTSVDPSLSRALQEAISLRKGKYVELQFLGNIKQAEEGTLTLLAAGDKDLCQKCNSCFKTIGDHVVYLGEIVGKAVKMNLLINMIVGSCYSAVAEAMALAERCGISLRDVVNIFDCGDLSCPIIHEQGNCIVNNQFNYPNLPLQHIQKVLYLALDVGEKCQLPLPTTAASHEVFKRAEQLGYKGHDASAVYMSARF